MRIFFLLILNLYSFLIFGYQAKPYDFPKPVDTTSKPINTPDREVKELRGVSFDNSFDGARINGLSVADTSFIIRMMPENEPINYSPWYAFKLWSKKDTVVHIVMDYSKFKYGQRYWPKLSNDGVNWTRLDESNFSYIGDSLRVRLTLSLSDQPLWVSAQEIQNSEMVSVWAQEIAAIGGAQFKAIGKTTLGRDIPMLEYVAGKKKPTIIVLSRQHPPEVTGYLAMKSFLERIFEVEDELSLEFLKNYNVLVFPLMNPDGVDLGHWRHNADGVDLNRDWAYYNQPETRQVADYIVNFAEEKKSDIVLGLDFHSTFKDIYYTNVDSLVSALPEFTSAWITNIKLRVEDSEAKVSASGIGPPVSKTWFYTQFNAVGITYEIGDDTPRDLINVKGEVSAEEMMKLLLNK
ncbi:MAG: M14 family metallopeptidase [Cyclobacteriaceae bacterium]|nr:M14 family metallopeptidase [Cyclobacteriaceae bacterium]